MILFDRQPTLTGSLLELRPLRPEDWVALFAVASDPLLWEQHPSPDRYKEEVFRQLFEEGLSSGGALAAVERTSGEIVGSSRYHGFDPEQSVVEIGWSFLARRCWGGTYNGEMKRLMLEHAFKTVARVVFVIGPDNHRSRRAVERIGATYVATTNVRGRESVVYELTRSAFATGPLSVAADAH
jgi:RimJ/RimL family protein N-acetyltransferase